MIFSCFLSFGSSESYRVSRNSFQKTHTQLAQSREGQLWKFTTMPIRQTNSIHNAMKNVFFFFFFLSSHLSYKYSLLLLLLAFKKKTIDKSRKRFNLGPFSLLCWLIDFPSRQNILWEILAILSASFHLLLDTIFMIFSSVCVQRLRSYTWYVVCPFFFQLHQYITPWTLKTVPTTRMVFLEYKIQHNYHLLLPIELTFHTLDSSYVIPVCVWTCLAR